MSLLHPDFNQTSTDHWQALILFNLYRVVLAIGFVAIVLFHVEVSFVGVFDENIYSKVTVSYLIASICFFWISLFIRKNYGLQANGPIFVDIISIILIMHACGGVVSGIGILLIVSIAAHSLIMPGKTSFLSAATATLGLLIQQSYTVLTQDNPTSVYTQAGLLGLAIFVTSCVTNFLSLRIRKSQLIVKDQAQQLATSQQLNAYIVSAMNAGVLVLDNNENIRLINLAAIKLLGLSSEKQFTHLQDLPTIFVDSVHTNKKQGKTIGSRQMAENCPEVRLSFHPLGQPLPMGELIFIFNAAEETQQAQDLKLASLGHLTANIAHELRNPLGAASHAAQLVAESNALSEEDYQLVKMIKDSCDRMNVVIQNVLSLSGRKASLRQEINLIPWLEQFIQNLVIPQIPNPKIHLSFERDDIVVHVDPSQLTQILIILCENGLRYSLRHINEALLQLKIKTTPANDAILIDVIDHGEGVPAQIAKHIFEPFFTTEQTGSGLGLYIAKELSQMNGARLTHNAVSEGYQFRITIPYQETSSWHNPQP